MCVYLTNAKAKSGFKSHQKPTIGQGIVCETKLQDKCRKISVSIEQNGKVRSRHVNYDISGCKEWVKRSFSENSMTVSCPVPNGSRQNTHTIILYRQNRLYLGIYAYTWACSNN